MNKKIKLLFVLTMPGCNSWNGKWPGENDFHGKIISVKETPELELLLKKGSFHYSWCDGWRALVNVTKPSPMELKNARKKIRRYGSYFCGYDWMIDSILSNGFITDKKTAVA